MPDEVEATAQPHLASLQALTDTTITALEVEDLLGELLSRVQEALDADTAAVLLLAVGAGELVATAARGLEEEVREGVRIPIGTGFAGRIAATRLGSRWRNRTASTTLPMPPGTAVVLYTDGLVERRGEPIDVGIERLRAAVSSAHPRELTADLMHRLVGTTITHDDIALVVLRRVATSNANGPDDIAS